MTDGEISRAFIALGHRHRLAIVRALRARALDCCAAERSEDCTLDPATCDVGSLRRFVDCAPSTLSHHLKLLDTAGLIERARSGRRLLCRINERRIQKLLHFLKGETDGN